MPSAGAEGGISRGMHAGRLGYGEKAAEAWQRKGRQNHHETQNNYSQPKRLSAGTTHRHLTGDCVVASERKGECHSVDE